MANHIRTTECTVQMTKGDFCDAPSAVDVPFPICQRHAKQLVEHYLSGQVEPTYLTPMGMVRYAVEHQSEMVYPDPKPIQCIPKTWVYYVRLGSGRIKIGYSRNVWRRMGEMRLHDPKDLLAVEPGGFMLEGERHRKFAHLRFGNLEEFQPAPDLMAWIGQVSSNHKSPRPPRR